MISRRFGGSGERTAIRVVEQGVSVAAGCRVQRRRQTMRTAYSFTDDTAAAASITPSSSHPPPSP